MVTAGRNIQFYYRTITSKKTYRVVFYDYIPIQQSKTVGIDNVLHATGHCLQPVYHSLKSARRNHGSGVCTELQAKKVSAGSGWFRKQRISMLLYM